MQIKVTLDIKFRAFFITFAQDHREWFITVPPEIPAPVVAALVANMQRLQYNAHGVKLAVSAQ